MNPNISAGSSSNFTDKLIGSLNFTAIQPMPLARAVPVALVLSSIVILCIFGNILVILSVFTFRPLRTVQNFFIVSLAFSDMLVAVIVMPFHIVTHILKRWIFGQIFCQVFVTSDVLLCTSSILNLCAIALDRYWAISDPIQYARQRTIRRVLLMIMLVWILSATISIPPIIATILGSDELRNFNNLQQCELSNNKFYVIYSACGSFYIPALIMTIVYAQVFLETRKRFRERARAAAKLANATRTQKSVSTKSSHHHHHRRRERSLGSSIINATNSSLKYSVSNGSVMENFSTDDAEEALYPKLDCSTVPPCSSNSVAHTTTTNHCIQSQKSDMSTSQMSLSLSIDESKLLPITCDTSPASGELTIPLFSQYSRCDSKFKTIAAGHQQDQAQHAAVQTREHGNKPKSHALPRLSKDTNRKILFKGKSLASLMHERQKISLTRERRLSRTLGIIISVFLLCWLPFFVNYILYAFIDVSVYIKEPLPTLILWLGYINSAVNPLIYTVFNVEFRTAFKRLLFPNTWNKFSKRTPTNKTNRRKRASD